jgi:hypothetical protein
VRSRARATVSRLDSVVSWAARIQHWCELCYCGLEKLKKESSTGHFENESKIIEEKILVSTRTPEDNL